jgi:hypothetical protein
MSHEPAPPLQIDPQARQRLEERGIRQDTLRQVISSAESAKQFHIVPVSGHHLAYLSLPKVTYWVEYLQKADTCTIFTAYSHRMKILEGFNLPPKQAADPLIWRCAACDAALEMAAVKLAYLDETFAVDLPACPSCQRVMISEETAVEKMALAEKMLEDK